MNKQSFLGEYEALVKEIDLMISQQAKVKRHLDLKPKGVLLYTFVGMLVMAYVHGKSSQDKLKALLERTPSHVRLSLEKDIERIDAKYPAVKTTALEFNLSDLPDIRVD